MAGDEGFGFSKGMVVDEGWYMCIWCIKVAKTASGNIEVGDWGLGFVE